MRFAHNFGLPLLILLLAATSITGCVTGTLASTSKDNYPAVSGTVTYRQRIALPPNAVVRVTLADVSLQDVAAKVLTEIEVPTDGRQVPIPFRLAYWPERIEATHTYSVRAQIVVDGALFMTSTTSYPVITRGAPTKLTIVVQPVN